MSIDLFGRKLKDKKGSSRGPPGIGYKLTADGQYNAEGKRICNIAQPKHNEDAVNLDFTSRLIDAEVRNINKKIDTETKKIDRKIDELKETLQIELTKVKSLLEKDHEIKTSQLTKIVQETTNKINEELKIHREEIISIQKNTNTPASISLFNLI